MKPIGIYGGTFDPVHYGHLRTALELKEGLGLAEVRLVPCRVPPHREVPGATATQRHAMLELALAGVKGLRLDARELEREGPSYMVDTLASLRAEVGDGAPLALIVGADAFAGLDGWHRWEEIPALAHIVVMTRPGGLLPEDGAVAELLRARRASPQALHRGACGAIVIYEVTQLDISATAVRDLVRAGRTIRFLLPDEVAEYIVGEGLYRAPPEN